MATRQPLLHRKHPLSAPEAQMEHLNNGLFESGQLPTFAEKLRQNGALPLKPAKLEILQVNIGYMCNQVCAHCHVDAGPQRKEMMDRTTMGQVIDALQKSDAHTLDITGGAPEMHPEFRWFVEEVRNVFGGDIIVRSNLTIILAAERYADLPDFFAAHRIHVVSSLPFYRKERTDRQRGDGVFEKSIEALRMLNDTGYGKERSGLVLDLVYNPSGAFLPASQQTLEAEFKKQLSEAHGIVFNNLFTITNLPISRFLEFLVESGNYEDYMEILVGAFNPATIEGVMCRNTLSVGYDGSLYDCDFNQMLHLPVAGKVGHISQFDEQSLSGRLIKISQHCYGCTAGAGSSCQGSLA